MNRQFNSWLADFRDSISTYDFYVDFDKVHANIKDVRVKLAIMNSLIGSKDIENDFDELYKQYPEILECIPILLAVRGHQISITDRDNQINYDFKTPNQSAKEYKTFMRETGLFDLISNNIIANLIDYATGVEVGLDSNGRKNRGGHLMENLVEKYIQKAGFVANQNYFKEMRRSDAELKWGIDLSAISNQGKTEKRFDFVVKTENMLYAIEANFYSSGGSKLNETARSYKNIAMEAKSISDYFTFIWFTDGKGWQSARHNLEETFDVMPHIYNINDLQNNIISKVIK